VQAKFTTKLQTIIYNDEVNLFLAAGGDGSKGVVNEYHDTEDREKREPVTMPCNNYRITNFTFIRSILNFTGIIAGTNVGTIKVFPEVFNGIPFENIPVHTGEITKVRASPNGRYLISTGEDGAIFIFQIQDLDSEGTAISSAKLAAVAAAALAGDKTGAGSKEGAAATSGPAIMKKDFNTRS
jgi:cilia- and flagella-associated protein 57